MQRLTLPRTEFIDSSARSATVTRFGMPFKALAEARLQAG